jgi:hypothetical protein
MINLYTDYYKFVKEIEPLTYDRGIYNVEYRNKIKKYIGKRKTANMIQDFEFKQDNLNLERCKSLLEKYLELKSKAYWRSMSYHWFREPFPDMT